MKRILFSRSIFFEQAAITENDKLQDFIFQDTNNCLGNIYKGKVMEVLPGIDAAFVDIGLEKNAYLYKADLFSKKFLKEKKLRKKDINNINEVIKKGEEILVQINREPIGEKNISVTTDISLSGKYIALLPGSMKVSVSKKISDENERERLKNIGKTIMTDGIGLIIRTFSQNCNEDEIENEYKALSNQYIKIMREYNYSYAPKLLYKSKSLVEKVFVDYVDSATDEIYVDKDEDKEIVYELIGKYNRGDYKDISVIVNSNTYEIFNIGKQINMLFQRKVELDNGGSIFIDVTEALTVIDVNSGRFTGNQSIEETALESNITALYEIARQIRLRNISGIIIIDFIDVMDQKNRNLIITKAKKIFKNDKAKINVLGMTKLNLMEMTRKRDKDNFYNFMNTECEYCNGSGRVSSKIYMFMRIENLIKKIKINEGIEAVIFNTGSVLYNKIIDLYKDILIKLEQKYDIKIYLNEDKSIITDDITIGKMGKMNYINQKNKLTN